MARPCSVCSDSRRAEVNAALTEGRPLRDIAEQFRIAVTSLHRHSRRHLGAQLLEADVSQPGTLLDRVAALAREAARLGRKAERGGDLRAALAAVREMTRLAELVGRLTGELREGAAVAVQVNVGDGPDSSLELDEDQLRRIAHETARKYLTPSELRALADRAARLPPGDPEPAAA